LSISILNLNLALCKTTSEHKPVSIDLLIKTNFLKKLCRVDSVLMHIQGFLIRKIAMTFRRTGIASVNTEQKSNPLIKKYTRIQNLA